MQVSIIVVTYNSEKTIQMCIDSILAQEVEKEIFVVDNNSKDRTVDIVSGYKQVNLIKNDTNLGFGKANNLAASKANGEFILFLNPDARIELGSLKKMIDYLSKNKEVTVLGPKLLANSGQVQKFNSKFPNTFAEILVLLRLHRIGFLRNFVYLNYDYDQVQVGEHLMGAALLIRRETFESVGGFDEKFFLWFEETDLLKRISEMGQKIVYFPEAMATHLVGHSTSSLNPIKKQNIWNKSLVYYFQKHDKHSVIILFPFIILSYPISVLTHIVKKFFGGKLENRN